MNLPTYALAEITVPDYDQHRHGMPQDQWTFLEDPYEYAVGGLTYWTIAGGVARACGNAPGGPAYGHNAVDLAGEILETTTIGHE